MHLTIALLVMASLLAGCSRADSPAGEQSADPIAAALLRSGTIREYISSIGSKWTYVHDDLIDGGVIVAVGEDREDHFTRGMTVKVMADGRVYVLTTQDDGEDGWKQEGVGPSEPIK